MSLRTLAVSGALAVTALTGVTLVGASASAATPDLASPVAVSLAGTDTPDATAGAAGATGRLGQRWLASLTPEQRQCLKAAGLTRPLFPLTDAEKATLKAQVKAAAEKCDVTLPTGERAKALKAWWGGLTDEQRSCLKDAGLTRPLGKQTTEERQKLLADVKAAAAKCGVTLPAPKAGPTT